MAVILAARLARGDGAGLFPKLSAGFEKSQWPVLVQSASHHLHLPSSY
jgi:hypothetical protein